MGKKANQDVIRVKVMTGDPCINGDVFPSLEKAAEQLNRKYRQKDPRARFWVENGSLLYEGPSSCLGNRTKQSFEKIMKAVRGETPSNCSIGCVSSSRKLHRGL